jgi:hypothetical protein
MILLPQQLTQRGCTGCREVDEDDEAAPWKEQENWESDQIKKASMKVGAKDKKTQEYEFVFEDQIDFIKDMALAGDVVSFPSFAMLPASFPQPEAGVCFVFPTRLPCTPTAVRATPLSNFHLRWKRQQHAA